VAHQALTVEAGPDARPHLGAHLFLLRLVFHAHSFRGRHRVLGGAPAVAGAGCAAQYAPASIAGDVAQPLDVHVHRLARPGSSEAAYRLAGRPVEAGEAVRRQLSPRVRSPVMDTDTREATT
jgi:hypothetical protein